MSRSRFELPSMSALLAFEATARLGSITLAAEERTTSHSAISRHIRMLEKTLGAALFERRGRGVALTKSGETYFGAVQSGLDALHDAGQRMRSNRRSGLTIGCTLEMSVLVLNRVFLTLKRTLGDSIAVRIVVYDYDLLPLLLPSGIDIVFEGVVGPHPNPQAVPLLREEIVPVASSAFMERFGGVLAEHPSTWSDVPRLDVPPDGPRLGNLGHVVPGSWLRGSAGPGRDVREPFQPATGRGQRGWPGHRLERLHERLLRDRAPGGGWKRLAGNRAHHVRSADPERQQEGRFTSVPQRASPAHPGSLHTAPVAPPLSRCGGAPSACG